MLFLFGALPIDQLKIEHTKQLKEIPSRHLCIYIFPAESEGKKCAKIMLNCESFARHDLWFLREGCSRALYFQQPIQPTKT